MKYTMKQVKVYVGRVSTDERFGYSVYGYYDSYSTALDDVKGKGWWGSDGSVDSTPVNAVIFTDENGNEFSFVEKSMINIKSETEAQREYRKKALRQSAISKLTIEERKAIGL